MKTRLISRASRYKSFVKSGILNTIAYRALYISWLLASSLSVIILCFLWYSIYNQANDALYEFNTLGQRVLNGFTMPQMITYMLIATVTSNLVTSTETFWTVASDIKEGNIAMQLIKPISYRLRCLSSAIGQASAFFLFFFIPLFLVIIVICGLIFGFDNLFFSFSWYNIPLYFVSLCLSLVLLDTLDFIVAQLIFFTGARFGLLLMKNSIFHFLGGAFLPLAFFPSWAQAVLNYLPFASLLSTPNLIIMGQYNLQNALFSILLQLGWVIFFSIVAKLTFKRSLKHVISFGG